MLDKFLVYLTHRGIDLQSGCRDEEQLSSTDAEMWVQTLQNYTGESCLRPEWHRPHKEPLASVL